MCEREREYIYIILYCLQHKTHDPSTLKPNPYTLSPRSLQDKTDDPILGPDEKCVYWYGDVTKDDLQAWNAYGQFSKLVTWVPFQVPKRVRHPYNKDPECIGSSVDVHRGV